MSANFSKPSAYAFAPRYTAEELEANDLESSDLTEDNPPAAATESSSDIDNDSETVFDQFCRCGCCYDFVGLPSVLEQRCCVSEDYTTAHFTNHVEGQCILATREIDVILSKEHLQLSWYQQRQYQGYTGDNLAFDLMTNKNYRYHAYRSYIQYMHGRLGRKNRRVIPACVVAKIRSIWPSTDGLYVGYKPAEDDNDPDAVDEIQDALFIPDD